MLSGMSLVAAPVELVPVLVVAAPEVPVPVPGDVVCASAGIEIAKSVAAEAAKTDFISDTPDWFSV